MTWSEVDGVRHEVNIATRPGEANKELNLSPSLQTHLYPTALDTLPPHFTSNSTPLYHLNN